MSPTEYLVSYGRAGEFGRFEVAPALACRRGDRVVIRTENGLELGTILCEAAPGHARFLSRTRLGEIVRRANAADEAAARDLEERGQRLFEHARRLADELRLPLEVVDVEWLLDGGQAVVHHLRREDCDYRPLVSTLSRTHDVRIQMNNLAVPAEAEEHGCGKPDCGQAGGGGGCTSCGTGGGCGTCGKGVKEEDVSAYLAGLGRTPLL